MSEGARPKSFESVMENRELAELEDDDILRYSRHLILPQVGVEGQKKLRAAKVLVVGTGGLGAPVALYLAAAGVGTIGLVDFDEVEASNLQRQIIHGNRDIGRPKVASARDRIRALNPGVKVNLHNLHLDSSNAMEILEPYDVIVDGSDNFQTRYLVNDACVMLGKPDVYGSVFQFEGLASVFDAKRGPCYRCLYPDPPPPGAVPSCGEAGVLGVLTGLVGTIQATEAIKLIVGGAEPLIGRLLALDAWKMKFSEYAVEKDPDCPVCGKNPSVTRLIDYEQFCGFKKEKKWDVTEIDPAELKRRLDAGDPIQLVDIREPHERAIAKLAGAKIMPYLQVVRRMDELDPALETVFVCKTGQKSVFVIEDLLDAGYKGKLLSLMGGINGWARDVDRSMPIY